MKNNQANCDPCEAIFEKQVKGLVKEVEGYTKKDHDKKKEELNKAFDEKPATADKK